jgi:hypothetical protein
MRPSDGRRQVICHCRSLCVRILTARRAECNRNRICSSIKRMRCLPAPLCPSLHPQRDGTSIAPRCPGKIAEPTCTSSMHAGGPSSSPFSTPSSGGVGSPPPGRCRSERPWRVIVLTAGHDVALAEVRLSPLQADLRFVAGTIVEGSGRSARPCTTRCPRPSGSVHGRLPQHGGNAA